MEIIRPPHIDTRPDQPYMGIRMITPFKGMTAMTRQLGKEVDKWITANGVETAGPPFVRLHVVDMRGEMDLTCGVPVKALLPDDGRITSGVLPGGRYASLVFTGNGVAGNGALIDWVRAQDNLAFDRWDTEQGDNFRGRYESYLTDPAEEPRKSMWQIEVAIKLAD